LYGDREGRRNRSVTVRDTLVGAQRVSLGLGDNQVAQVGLAAAIAVFAGYELVHTGEQRAVALCLLPLVAILLARPTVLLVPLGASIPLLHSFTVAGYFVTLSDLLLVLIVAGILLQAVITGSAPAIRALRPVALPLTVYASVMIVLLPAHLSFGEVVKTGQRFELFVFPLLVGAFAALAGRHLMMLQAYVLSATVLAVAWPLNLLAGQKNGVGQLIGSAILLLVGVPALRRLLPCLVILVPALLVTESRGAIIATIVGVVVIMAMQGLAARLILTRAVPLAVIAAVAFVLMPVATQDRITTVSAGTETRAAYAIEYRQKYKRDAWQIIRAHPLTGVGVGNYVAGNTYDLTGSTDPHQVLLLQAAEGGYVLAAAFVLLIVGSVIVLYRMRRVDIAPAATGVLVASVAHGLVDVYWVRVTPVLGWLLVGMVCGLYAKSRDNRDQA
jgi:O-antigen ligase